MKRGLVTTAALVAAVALSGLIARPPTPLLLETPWHDGSIAGAIHVHTDRSDGSSPPDVIAEAAARAGLQFVVFTDHGDGTRTPDAPSYRHGVLCLEGVEISTSGGHYVAIDLPAAPYPLAGEPRDVVDDVRRLGGFGIAAHPDSPKRELQWGGWQAPYDGVELINPDSSWRAHAVSPRWRTKFRLALALVTYPYRHAETIAGLLTDSPATVERWQAATATRRVVGLAGIDAHARLGLGDAEPGDNRLTLPVPGYEASFRALSVRIYPGQPLSGLDAAADARQLITALRAGRLYTVVDGWARNPAFEFTARNSTGAVMAGGELAVDGTVTLRVRSNAPAGFTTTLWRDAVAVATSSRGEVIDWSGEPTAAVYRAEIRADDRPAGPPWIISNPIYLRSAVQAIVQSAAPLIISKVLFNSGADSQWITEADATSLAAVAVVPRLDGSALQLRYGLSGGADIGQFAATAVAIPEGIASYDRLSFTISSERPMRVSVQVRVPTPGHGNPSRWQRSIYVGPDDMRQVVAFHDMSPVAEEPATALPAAAVRDVLFVVDTVNTRPGTSGRIWLRDVRLEK